MKHSIKIKRAGGYFISYLDGIAVNESKVKIKMNSEYQSLANCVMTIKEVRERVSTKIANYDGKRGFIGLIHQDIKTGRMKTFTRNNQKTKTYIDGSVGYNSIIMLLRACGVELSEKISKKIKEYELTIKEQKNASQS